MMNYWRWDGQFGRTEEEGEDIKPDNGGGGDEGIGRK
jgi:hypothetical protein